MKYRKTALVEAEQFLPADGKIPAGVIADGLSDPRKSPSQWVLDTLEGRHTLRPGDYICTGPAGERWNVEQSIFEATYEPAASSAPVAETAGEAENHKRAWINRWNAIEDAARDAVYTMTELLAAPSLKRMQYALGERRDALSAALNLPEAGTAWMRATPPVPAQDDDKLRIAVEALEPFSDAYQAYVAVYSELGEFAPSAATEAEKRFWEGEREDTAKEAAFDALSKINFDQLHAVNKALAALKSTAAQEGG